MASIPFLVLLFIGRVGEEASTVLLRDLKATKRLTWTECDALRSCTVSYENSSQCKCDYDFKHRNSKEPRQRSEDTLMQLLLERRISTREYDILQACRRSGKLSWRQVAKHKIVSRTNFDLNDAVESSRTPYNKDLVSENTAMCLPPGPLSRPRICPRLSDVDQNTVPTARVDGDGATLPLCCLR